MCLPTPRKKINEYKFSKIFAYKEYMVLFPMPCSKISLLMECKVEHKYQLIFFWRIFILLIAFYHVNIVLLSQFICVTNISLI